MAKKEETAPDEFPVSLDEFLGEIPRGKETMKDGFRHACKASGIIGHRLRNAWQTLLTQYNNQPGDVLLRQEGGK